ncbi:MAG: DUF5667 domain-containing protein [Patescibacteria group bacterium]
MSQELIRQLKQLKHHEVNPSEAWLKNNRALLLSQIKNTIGVEPNRQAGRVEKIWAGLSIFLPQPMVYNFVRPMATLLIIAMVATSGWIATVDASYNAIPGEWLYPAKRATEKTQVTVASLMGSKTTETKLHVEFAKRRAAETKKIVAGVDPAKNAHAKQSVADLKTEIASVNNKLEESKASAQGSLTAETVKDVSRDAEEIKNVLQNLKTDLLTSTTTADKDLSKDITEVKDLVKDAGVKAVEVMISKHLEGDTSVSKEEVTQAVGNSLQTAVADAAVSKQNVEGINDAVEAVKTEVKDLTAEQKKDSALVSSTKELNIKITDMSAQTKEAAVKSEAVAVDVGKKAGEAKDLLSQGDLSKAMDKVKEISAAGKEAEKISDATLKSAQNVLTAVNVVKDNLPVVLPVATDTKAIVVIITTTPSVVSSSVLTTTTVKTIKIIVTSTVPVKITSTTPVIKPTVRPAIKK